MSEQNQNPEGQKTIVAFIVGLLVGGLIVYMFFGSPAEAPTTITNDDNGTATTTPPDTEEDEDSNDSTVPSQDDTSSDEPAPVMEIGEGSVSVTDQSASSIVDLEAVTFPMSDGWIGVREFTNDQLGSILGVMRFSESQGLIPEEIRLIRPTTAGREYAIVFFTSDGTREFNLATNVQVEGIAATFTAQ